MRRDFAAAGEAATPICDFVETTRPYPTAIPVLIDHLQRGGYPSRVVERIATEGGHILEVVIP